MLCTIQWSIGDPVLHNLYNHSECTAEVILSEDKLNGDCVRRTSTLYEFGGMRIGHVKFGKLRFEQ